MGIKSDLVGLKNDSVEIKSDLMGFNGDSNHNGDHSMGIAWDI